MKNKLFDIGIEYTRKSDGGIVKIVNYINFEPQLQCWKIQVEEDSFANPIILSERDLVGFEQAYNFNPPSRLPSNETKNLHKKVDEVLKVKSRLDEKIDASRYPYHVGIYREYLLKQLILDLLKKDLKVISSQIGITSGFIWKSENEYSRQVDIIVFSNPEKALLKYGDFSLVAPEDVIAAVEIKTDLEKIELNKALDNVKSIQEVIRKSNNLSPPFVGVVAYSFLFSFSYWYINRRLHIFWR